MEASGNHRIKRDAPLSMAGGAAAFVLTLLFAVFALLAMVSGVNAYNAVTARTEQTAQRRDTLLYVMGKIRSADGAARLDVVKGAEGASDTLILTQTFDGTAYETRVSLQGGELTELFVEAGTDTAELQGEVIGRLNAFYVTKGTPVRVQIETADGQTREGAVYLRAEAGEQ